MGERAKQHQVQHQPPGIGQRAVEQDRILHALIEMARSRSYLITASAGERARIEAELRALFGTLPALRDGGAIELPYRTHAFRAVRP